MKGFIKFVRNYEKGSDEEEIYDIINKKDDEIGEIMYDEKWKTWIFVAGIGCFFDIKCMNQITSFLAGLNTK